MISWTDEIFNSDNIVGITGKRHLSRQPWVCKGLVSIGSWSVMFNICYFIKSFFFFGFFFGLAIKDGSLFLVGGAKAIEYQELYLILIPSVTNMVHLECPSKYTNLGD